MCSPSYFRFLTHNRLFFFFCIYTESFSPYIFVYSTHIDHCRVGKNGASEVLNSRPKRAVAPSAKLRDTDNVATHELTSHQHAALARKHLSSPQDNGNFFSSLLATDVSTSPPSTPPSASQKRKESPGTTTDPGVLVITLSDDNDNDNDSTVSTRITKGM